MTYTVHRILQNLDIQYTIGIATGVPTVFYSVGENFQDGDLEGFLDITNALLADSAPPSVVTTSYGSDEKTISRSLAMYVLRGDQTSCYRVLILHLLVQEPLQRLCSARSAWRVDYLRVW